MLQDRLEELRQRFSTLRQAPHQNPQQVLARLPDLLADLQCSLEELQAIAAQIPHNGHTEPRAPARSDGKRSRAAEAGCAPRFQELAQSGAVLVRSMHTDARCSWTNRAWHEFTGRSMKQLLGDGWLQDVHPEDRERCAGTCRGALDSNGLYWDEYRLQRKGGGYGWVLEIGTPRLTSRGRVVGYLGTAIEITEHKQAQTRLALQLQVARVLAEAKSLEEAVAPILPRLCEDLGWDVGDLWSVDSEERVPRRARLWAAPSVDVSALLDGARTGLPSGGNGRHPPSDEPIWIADMAIDEALAREPEAERVGLHGMFRLPVSVQGEMRAILRVFSRGVRPKDERVAEVMTAIVFQLGQFLERQRSAERMLQSEARKTAILEASPDAVITIDDAGRVLEFNSAAARLFGCRREDVLGRGLPDLFVPPRLRAAAVAELERYRATGDGERLALRFGAFALKSDGAEFPVEVASAPSVDGTARLLTLYVRDATSRRDAEREVRRQQRRHRALTAELLLAEEHERRRLAVDLHDGLSQTIALTQIKLATLRRTAKGATVAALDEIDALIRQSNREARSISHELSPAVLHELGLEPAVQGLVESIQQRYGIAIVLEDDGLPKPVDEQSRVILFRAIRDLLINAAKHAAAQRVQVRLQREGDQLRAWVEDDGVGMAPAAASGTGTGLLSIRERIGHIGGSVHIETAPGRGTRIRLCAPLENSGPQKKSRVKA